MRIRESVGGRGAWCQASYGVERALANPVEQLVAALANVEVQQRAVQVQEVVRRQLNLIIRTHWLVWARATRQTCQVLPQEVPAKRQNPRLAQHRPHHPSTLVLGGGLFSRSGLLCCWDCRCGGRRRLSNGDRCRIAGCNTGRRIGRSGYLGETTCGTVQVRPCRFLTRLYSRLSFLVCPADSRVVRFSPNYKVVLSLLNQDASQGGAVLTWGAPSLIRRACSPD